MLKDYNRAYLPVSFQGKKPTMLVCPSLGSVLLSAVESASEYWNTTQGNIIIINGPDQSEISSKTLIDKLKKREDTKWDIQEGLTKGNQSLTFTPMHHNLI